MERTAGRPERRERIAGREGGGEAAASAARPGKAPGRHAILHIGPMKTGSTSIQFWLGQERKRLLERGYLVPQAFGALNMSRLAGMAVRQRLGKRPSPDAAEVLEKLSAEMAAAPAGVRTAIISAEMLGQRLRSGDRVRALKAMLDPIFDSYSVVVYLRRQDEQVVSLYSTLVRRGDEAEPLSRPIDYDAMLRAWARVFGRETIRARLFERDAMPQGNIIYDFIEAAGIGPLETELPPVERNPSLRPEAQEMLVRLARVLRADEKAPPMTEQPGYQALMNALNEHFSGRGRTPARAEAIAYFEALRESNERVRRKWFPDRKQLFREDFSRYPDTATPEPETAAVLDAALAGLAALMTMQRRRPEPGAIKEERKRKREQREKRKALRERETAPA